MSVYRYDRLSIRDGGDNATVTVYGKLERHSYGFNQSVPPEHRREAAQQLAGDDYRVVPRDLTVGDLAQIARDAGVKLDMDVQLSEPLDSKTVDHGRTVTVAWHAEVDGEPSRILVDADNGILVSSDESGRILTHLPPPEKAQTQLDYARVVTPDGWTIVPSESATNAAAMQEDLRAILDALGLSTASRPYSPHEVVEREIVPAIWSLRRALGGDPPKQPDRPEPVDPASGAGLIAAERGRQVSDEGYVAEHDDRHDDGQLLQAAATYVLEDFAMWPWGNAPKFTSNDRVRELVKAGALIAAEIDRLQRAEPEPDEAAVEALERAFSSVGIYLSRETKRQLIRDHGVQVGVSE